MSFSVADLLSSLDLEKIEENVFRGRSPQVGWQRIFGGLVISQALVAAARTVPDRAPHSLHGYFILPGDPSVPILFEVDRLRDGRSFSTRQCVAIQHGRPIFSLLASFQVVEAGLDHQLGKPNAPPPESLPTEAEFLARAPAFLPEAVRSYFGRERPVELRPVELSRYARPAGGDERPPRQQIWMRATGRLPDDPAVHRAFLAFMSDMSLLDVTMVAHGRSVFEPSFQVASLDHSLWFHRPFRADEWLLYDQDSPNTAGARGLGRGLFYAEDGTLVASVAQEGLIRQRSA